MIGVQRLLVGGSFWPGNPLYLFLIKNVHSLRFLNFWMIFLRFASLLEELIN